MKGGIASSLNYAPNSVTPDYRVAYWLSMLAYLLSRLQNDKQLVDSTHVTDWFDLKQGGTILDIWGIICRRLMGKWINNQATRSAAR
jgi:hypothetical protein